MTFGAIFLTVAIWPGHAPAQSIQQPARVVGAFTANDCSKIDATGFLVTNGSPCGSSSGTVTQVNTGCGVSGGPITGTGTVLGIGVCVTIANESGTGTTTNLLVKLTGAPSTAIITATTDTSGIIGVCDSACGKTGSAVIQQAGLHITVVDGGGSVAGHWAIQSTSTVGDTADSGIASTAAAPAGAVGIYLATLGGFSTVVTDLVNNQAAVPGSGPTANQNIRDIGFNFSNSGSVLAGTTVACDVVEAAGTIAKWYVVGDVSGSATIGFKSVALGSYTGIAGYSGYTDVTGGGTPPSLTTAVQNSGSTLTSWVTTVTAGAVYCVQVSSPSTVTSLNVHVQYAAN